VGACAAVRQGSEQTSIRLITDAHPLGVVELAKPLPALAVRLMMGGHSVAYAAVGFGTAHQPSLGARKRRDVRRDIATYRGVVGMENTGVGEDR
jgi:hypothetical protein